MYARRLPSAPVLDTQARGLAFFVLCLVAFRTATRPDWFGVAIAAPIGLVLAFGGPLEVSEK